MNDVVLTKEVALAKDAARIIAQNKECFVAQWILQHPYEDIDKYTLCYKQDAGVVQMWVVPRIVIDEWSPYEVSELSCSK